MSTSPSLLQDFKKGQIIVNIGTSSSGRVHRFYEIDEVSPSELLVTELQRVVLENNGSQIKVAFDASKKLDSFIVPSYLYQNEVTKKTEITLKWNSIPVVQAYYFDRNFNL